MFGAPLHQITEPELATENVVFQIGLPPNRIDLLTSITGVAFKNAWERRISINIDGIEIPVIGIDDLMENKRATGRPRDLADVAELKLLKRR